MLIFVLLFYCLYLLYSVRIICKCFFFKKGVHILFTLPFKDFDHPLVYMKVMESNS